MKKSVNIKKMVLPNIPYVFIALLATKLGQAARLAPGFDFSSKAIHIIDGMTMAFQTIVPSFHPVDLCVGIAAAAIIRLVVYVKGKNAKKYPYVWGGSSPSTSFDCSGFVSWVLNNCGVG